MSIILSGTSGITSPNSDRYINGFRLTLTSGTPVTTSDVTGATTIYCTPYTGNLISLYNGSTWAAYASSEFSLALGTLTSGKPYDVFCYDNAGAPTLEFLVWTNDTTRATALAYQDGVLVKSGAATRRYLGTFYTTAATTTEDSAANRYLWNYYNRVVRQGRRVESTANWTYSTAAYRQVNGSTANQINFVSGAAEDSIFASTKGNAVNSTATFRGVYSALALDSTTVPTEGAISFAHVRNDINAEANVTCAYPPQLGRHYIAMLEQGAGADTQTWYGNNKYSCLNVSLTA